MICAGAAATLLADAYCYGEQHGACAMPASQLTIAIKPA